MDKLDRKILMSLQQNGKQNTKEIAAKLGLTATPTYERIKRLEQSGVIKKYVAILDRNLIGKQIIAYCQITLFKHQKELIDAFKTSISSLQEVMECHHVSGNFDFLLKTRVADMSAYRDLLGDILLRLPAVSESRTYVVMEEVKSDDVSLLKVAP